MDKISSISPVAKGIIPAVAPGSVSKDVSKSNEKNDAQNDKNIKKTVKNDDKSKNLTDTRETESGKTLEYDQKNQKISGKSVDKTLRMERTKISFKVDDDTNKVIVKVIDAETGEEVRQIPSEELVDIAKNVERYKGRILDHIV